jgi:hypothetical protein
MTTRATFRAYQQYEYEDLTGETVGSGAPLQFSDDFIGAGHTAGIPAAGSPVAGYPWVKKIVGAAPPTVALVTNGAGGQVACTLTSASQAQEASLYWNDNLAINTAATFGQIEFRAALSVLPSAAGAGAALGLGAAWASGGPLSAAEFMLFSWSGNGNLTISANDGTNSFSFAAKQNGGSAVASDTKFHVFRIDWNNPADISFWYDGNRVNATDSVTWSATGPSAILQPWASAFKASGAGVGTLAVDKVDIFNSRGAAGAA